MDQKQQDAKEGAGYAAQKYEKWAVRPSLYPPYPAFQVYAPQTKRNAATK